MRRPAEHKGSRSRPTTRLARLRSVASGWTGNKQMKSVFAVVIAALTMATPAFAGPITIEFKSAGVPAGDNGGKSYITVNSPTVASGKDLAISTMIVSGDAGFDGTYAVTGAVAGFGALFRHGR